MPAGGRGRRGEAVDSGGGAGTIARRVAARFVDPRGVAEVRFVTSQVARWGSDSRQTGIVRLNAALRQMPPWVLEAVVAHELAHAFHLDHSPAFWELVLTAVILLIIWRLFEGMQRYIGNGETTLFLQFPVWWAYAASFAAGIVSCIVAVYCAVIRVIEAIKDENILPSEQGAH